MKHSQSMMHASMAAIAILALSACALSGPKESPLPHDGPTMIDIYHRHMNDIADTSEAAVRERLPIRPSTDDTPGELHRMAMAAIDNRFPRLPNPDLVMIVLPHLAKGQYPIPGYVTVFPMYERIEYAMPGEVATRHGAPIVPSASPFSKESRMNAKPLAQSR